jgi:hypothetical protein
MRTVGLSRSRGERRPGPRAGTCLARKLRRCAGVGCAVPELRYVVAA